MDDLGKVVTVESSLEIVGKRLMKSSKFLRGALPRTPPGRCPGPRRGAAPDPAGALPRTLLGLSPRPPE